MTGKRKGMKLLQRRNEMVLHQKAIPWSNLLYSIKIEIEEKENPAKGVGAL